MPAVLMDFWAAGLRAWAALRHVLCTRPYPILLLAAVVVYGVVFAHFTVQKHYVFHTHAWDLGIFNQALYNTLFSGRTLYYTVELFLNPSGHYFAVHLSPILFLVLPVYALLPAPTTLLVLKSFLLAAGAFPLFLLAKTVLRRERTAFLLALAYLLYPPLQGANWFDFQPQAFLPLLTFALCYFMVQRRWRYYFPVLLLTLLVEEHVVFVVFLLAAYFFLRGDLRSLYASLKPLRLNETLVAALTMVGCGLYFIVSLSVKNLFPIAPEYLERYQAVSAYSVLGLEADPLSLPSYVLQHPDRVVSALLYDFPLKFLYLVLLFAPLLFLPFSSRLTLGSVLLLAPFLLSNYPAYYMIGVHYPLYVLAFLFIATVEGLTRLPRSAQTLILKTVLISTLFLMISTSPLLPPSTAFVEDGLLMYPDVTYVNEAHVTSLHALLDVLPPNASILTQNHLFPHVSNRVNAYVIPYYAVGDDFIHVLVNRSEYVLLDLTKPTPMSALVLDQITRNASYGCYALAYNAILFKHAYFEEPLFPQYSEHKVYAASIDLFHAPSSQLVVDPSAVSPRVVYSPQASSETFVYGPYSYLIAGSYEITYTLKVGDHPAGHLGTLLVTDHERVRPLCSKDVYGFELPTNTWTNITLSFTSTTLRTGLEFQVASSGAADLYVDRVVVNRVSPDARVDFGSTTFTYHELPLASGYLSDDGLLIHPSNMTNTFFWYGPYVNLPDGRFTATLFMKTAPTPGDPNERLLFVDVTAEDGDRQILPASAVNGSSLIAPDGLEEWRAYTLEFSVATATHVEIRGFYPSPYYNISLGFILLERTGVSLPSDLV